MINLVAGNEWRILTAGRTTRTTFKYHMEEYSKTPIRLLDCRDEILLLVVKISIDSALFLNAVHANTPPTDSNINPPAHYY
ncbi:hypothetical protein CEXT_648941 [Caerostris extrusa]|uniref:Uncharacterized protein n=1 Tax=Caerostris extrusa TaxID=172846 RepID=A0AAV4SJ78_CAEEX|nr:hypothetical protein CEXT_648941 [Caerostris extrusa]